MLEMPSAHEEWLVLPSWRVLHRIVSLAPDDVADGIPNGTGRALCGASGRFSVPGFLSRMGLKRCDHCCDLLGIPRGVGNTLNAGIAEQVPSRRWEHFDALCQAWVVD